MTWEQKIEMVKLHNQGKQKDMQDFVEPLIDTMDSQAEDMLFNCIELIPENILQNKPFFKKLADHMQKSQGDFGLRTGIRIEYFKLINAQLQAT